MLVKNKNNKNKDKNRGIIITTTPLKKKRSTILLNNIFFVIPNKLVCIIKVLNIVLFISFGPIADPIDKVFNSSSLTFPNSFFV